MPIQEIELYHPNVHGGEPVRMVVQMTRIYCSPPNHIGRKRMDPIDIVVPLRSDEQRLLHEFAGATRNPSSGSMRLVAGDHVGGWSVRSYRIEGENMRYSLFHSGRHPNPHSPNPPI